MILRIAALFLCAASLASPAAKRCVVDTAKQLQRPCPAIAQCVAGLLPRIAAEPPRRVIILKIDGLNADLLYRTMRETDPNSGKSRLPWFAHIFAENGSVFENFYTRGISLSAPSWSMLDTGRHTVIRGNVEYDRYTGHVYDYLNFFPFYIAYARHREIDMPGVQVLDRAGIPLLIDSFPYPQRFQSFQLFQRGVRWTTLKAVLERRFSSKVLFSMVENAGTPSLDELLADQTEKELDAGLAKPEILYLDFYTGDVDHEGHATSQPGAMFAALQRLDGLAGRIWTAIQASPLAQQTIFVAVSDHGMNNVPGIISQSFSLPDLFNSPAGGAHHVITNRHQLSDYKLVGLNPLVHRVITPSTASFYLAGQAGHYPTAWLDLDGNERASVLLRNSDVNKIHILLLQLANPQLDARTHQAAVTCVREIVNRHRTTWTKDTTDLAAELGALSKAIEQRKISVEQAPSKWNREQIQLGEDKQAWRRADELQSWQREYVEYSDYIRHVEALLNWQPGIKISEAIPEMSLGDNNTVRDLAHYAVGPAPGGLVLDAQGNLDQERSFRYVDYFSLLLSQEPRNNPQPQLPAHPVDFIATRLPGPGQTYWLYGGEDNQLLISVDESGRLTAQPVSELLQDGNGQIHWTPKPWQDGLPLHLFEDPALRIPEGIDRSAWLSEPHSEREWLEATHMCRYSNGLIGVTEELSPVADNVPGPAGLDPLLLRYERRRRELVQPDFEVFAADHWNFNVRNFNPGGNHGSFFRISTHSVWMMAGDGIPTRSISEPYDSLNFASTVLNLLGRTPPIPDRVVSLP